MMTRLDSRRIQSMSTGQKILVAAVFVTGAGLSGCASQTGYNSAFANSTALAGNSRRFSATPDQTFKTVKITLVQQGFTIEQTDAANGLIKGVRALEDPKNKKISYLITTSVDVTGAPSGDATVVTASASQQTVLHKDSEKYFHLLGLVPIPTGKDYQTIVRKEGNITDASFYKDLFSAVESNLPKAPAVATFAAPTAPASVVTAAPVPAVSAPVAAASATTDGSSIAPATTSEATPAPSPATNVTTAVPPANP
jgi:hypothetical protein